MDPAVSSIRRRMMLAHSQLNDFRGVTTPKVDEGAGSSSRNSGPPV